MESDNSRNSNIKNEDKLNLKTSTPETRKRRISPDNRRQEFVEKAIEIFAEHGFEGSTRQLASQLGVTQPLLYRYFPNKESLIEEVTKSVYLDRWKTEWDQLLCDRSVELRERLERFYNSYSETIFSRDWMRIYLYAGLRHSDINRWYIGLLEERILKRIALECRHTFGLDAETEPNSEEIELCWCFHAGIFYIGVRKHIFDLSVRQENKKTIANSIEVFLEGMQVFLRKRYE